MSDPRDDTLIEGGPSENGGAQEPGLGLLGGGPAKVDEGYRVLARKYRPNAFDELIGQDALVRTLTNAFASGRIAHGFILTGIRGVGKTTTARIIAKGLNCIGPDGQSKNDGAPTVNPCGVCENCVAIAESRHIDVLEMDAASRTGIDDIREIIEGVRYASASARFKVYIIDEVHMLSKAAFNGLLKTLEEPPPHVKFVFATTEIRKVPVTILSRCQRFDLRRIEPEQLVEHMRSIAVAEGVKIEAAALGVIAKAAEGSDRDALSLLDQAIAHSHGGDISEDQVREMLGLADRTRILDLMDHVFSGDIKSALDELRDQYESGADPVIVLQDLLDLTHVITRLKITSETDSDPSANEQQIKRAREMADRLPMSVLSRNWSMLLKGLSETRNAPQPIAAAEMVLVRLAYVADLPTPDEAIRKIVQGAGAASASGAGASAPAKAAPAKVTTQAVAHAGARDDNNRNRPSAQVAQQMPVAKPQVVSDAAPSIHLSSLQEIIDLASERRDIALKTQLEDFVHLVAFEPGKIEFRPAEQAPSDLAGRLAERLANWTQERWVVTVTMAGGAPTVSEARRAREKQEKDDVARDPLVASVLDIFPGAKIVRIRDIAAEAGADIIAAPDDEDLSE